SSAGPNSASRSGATWLRAGEASTRFGAASRGGICSTAATAAGSALTRASGSRGWIAQPKSSRSTAVTATNSAGHPRQADQADQVDQTDEVDRVEEVGRCHAQR